MPDEPLLERIPARAIAFLRAAGTNLAIRRLLAQGGYTEQDHQEGWSLLHLACGFGRSGPPRAEDAEVRDAIAALDEWDERGCRIVRATLERHHPGIARVVLDGVCPGRTWQSVQAVALLLERLDALQRAGDEGHSESAQAIDLLQRRGITAAERARLKALVADARSGQPKETVSDTARASDLQALSLWLDEWSAVAEAVIVRVDARAKLGIDMRQESSNR